MKVGLKDIVQFSKFAAVGAANTVVSMAVYYLCLLLLGFDYLIGNTAGYLAGTVNAFYWNNRYVFQNEPDKGRSPKKAFVKSFIAYGSTYLLSTALLYLWVDILHISAVLAPVINLFITMPLNFFLNKLWAFQPGRNEG